jgi:hypothetical protein
MDHFPTLPAGTLTVAAIGLIMARGCEAGTALTGRSAVPAHFGSSTWSLFWRSGFGRWAFIKRPGRGLSLTRRRRNCVLGEFGMRRVRLNFGFVRRSSGEPDRRLRRLRGKCRIVERRKFFQRSAPLRFRNVISIFGACCIRSVRGQTVFRVDILLGLQPMVFRVGIELPALAPQLVGARANAVTSGIVIRTCRSWSQEIDGTRCFLVLPGIGPRRQGCLVGEGRHWAGNGLDGSIGHGLSPLWIDKPTGTITRSQNLLPDGTSVLRRSCVLEAAPAVSLRQPRPAKSSGTIDLRRHCDPRWWAETS